MQRRGGAFRAFFASEINVSLKLEVGDCHLSERQLGETVKMKFSNNGVWGAQSEIQRSLSVFDRMARVEVRCMSGV